MVCVFMCIYLICCVNCDELDVHDLLCLLDPCLRGLAVFFVVDDEELVDGGSGCLNWLLA